MPTTDVRREPKVARVDQLVDENGEPIALPENTALEATNAAEETVGGTGPIAWRMGLIGLGIVIAILLLFQLLMGRTGTDEIPGTPTAAPQQTTTQ